MHISKVQIKGLRPQISMTGTWYDNGLDMIIELRSNPYDPNYVLVFLPGDSCQMKAHKILTLIENGPRFTRTHSLV